MALDLQKQGPIKVQTNLVKKTISRFLVPGSLISTEARSRSSDEPSDDWTVSRGGERRD